MPSIRPRFRVATVAAALACLGCGGREDLSKSTVPPGESPTEKTSKAPAPAPVVGGPGGVGTDPGGVAR